MSKKTVYAALLAAGLGFSALAAGANAVAAVKTEPDPALVDAIVHRMESDGSLDQAVESALGRIAKRQEDARRAEQARAQQQLEAKAEDARAVSAGRDHIRGNPAAPVSLIEYSDFECPYCKRFHATPKVLLERFGGKVNWVWRHFPLSFHEPVARQEAIASECAATQGGNDAFWKYADALFANTQSNGHGLPGSKTLQMLATETGLDGAVFSRCLAQGQVAKRIDEDIADGAKAGVNGTPTTLIRNNRTGATEVVVGALPAAALAAAIERELGQARH